MQHSQTRNPLPSAFSWKALLAVSAVCLLAGSAVAADRVVIAEAFVDDG